MPFYVSPSLWRLDDGTFINAFYVVSWTIGEHEATLTLAEPDASGSRRVVIRDPETVEKIKKMTSRKPPNSYETETEESPRSS